MARPEVPLDEAALLIAAHGQPHVDVDSELARLDELAAACPEASVEGVTGLLFERLGFHGNLEDYGDPRNSFLDQVMDRRVGIPITLSVLTIEVGRRVGVAFEGIGMPGHFLVRHAGSPAIMLDPFHGGQVIAAHDAEVLYRRIHGDAAAFSPALLAPSPPRAILARMLFNLRNAYRVRGEASGLAWVGRLLASMPHVGGVDVLDTARLLTELGRFNDAASVLESLSGRVDSGEDAERLRASAGALRARLN